MKTGSLNVRISIGLKKAVDKYCKDKGLKIQTFVEDLIRVRVEDEYDLKVVDKRKNETTLSLKEVVTKLGLGKEHTKTG